DEAERFAVQRSVAGDQSDVLLRLDVDGDRPDAEQAARPAVPDPGADDRPSRGDVPAELDAPPRWKLVAVEDDERRRRDAEEPRPEPVRADDDRERRAHAGERRPRAMQSSPIEGLCAPRDQSVSVSATTRTEWVRRSVMIQVRSQA